jgi:predicted RNase H-like HicB family nuclease
MAMPTVKVRGNVQWRVTETQGGNWLAVCEPLRLTLQAETYAELMEDIGLALDGMLRDLLETNDLQRFLLEHGWTLVGAIPARPEEVRFDVPFHLLSVSHGQERDLHQ